MSVTVAYTLSSNSNVGISGFVEQVVVPEPNTAWLLGLGILALSGIARRRRIQAT
jgi:PEP-CTERM motif-containing protein